MSLYNSSSSSSLHFFLIVIAKSFFLFNNLSSSLIKLITSKINIPIYEPKNAKPHILELCDVSKYKPRSGTDMNSSLSLNL